MLIGKLREIWRYPVKSLGGSTVETAYVHDKGVAGDRAWAAIDEETGDICTAKRLPGLLNMTARFEREPQSAVAYTTEIPPVAIGFPDGREIAHSGPQSSAVSEYLGKSVRLHPLEPPENQGHYRMSSPPSEEEFNRSLNIGKGEKELDFSEYDPTLIQFLMEYSSIPGTYYDAFPLHMVTTAALDHMRDLTGEDFDIRRFRPNLLIETATDTRGFAEFDWIGKTLKIDEVELKVESRTLRCSMPAREQQHCGLERNPGVSKALYQTTNRFLGVNLAVSKTGWLRSDAEVELLA